MQCSRRQRAAAIRPRRRHRPLLRDRQSPDAFLHAGRRRARGRRRVLRAAQRRDAGRGRRIRLRQERHRAVDPAPGRQPAGPHRRRRDPLRGQRTCSSSARAEMERIRGNDISMIFQEPMTSLNPLFTVGRQISEAIALHQGLSRRDAMDQRGRDAAPRPHPGAGAPRARLSAPALGRHAPARDDRHGAVVQSQGADRRRADHRARRHHPGADPRPDARAAGHARHRDHPDHPRHGRGRRERRPGRGDVCRPQGRGGERRRSVRAARAIPTRKGLLGSIPNLDAGGAQPIRAAPG